MKSPNNETRSAWLKDRLPPTRTTFAEIVRAYISSQDRPRFFQTILSLEEGAYGKLVETLMLYRDVFLQEADQTGNIRRAYQHYIVNTDGPIPPWEGKDSFNEFEWATEYAAAFNITLREKTNPNGRREILMIIDDRDNPIRLGEWGQTSGMSSALSLRKLGHLINQCRYGRYDVIPSRLFPFEPHSPSYSKFNAMQLADLSQLVYFNEWYARAQLTNWGFERIAWIESKDTDTQAFVAAKRDYVVVSFRGTKGIGDFITDLLFRKVPFDTGGREPQGAGKAHRGFVRAIDSVWEKVLAAVNKLGPDRPVFVTGHSLGAALAQLAAVRLIGNGKTVAAVYVYGSPRLGDETFGVAYDRVLKGKTYLHINDQDIVPTVPISWMGFYHVAQPARRFNKGHEISYDNTESESQEAIPHYCPTGVRLKSYAITVLLVVLIFSQTLFNAGELKSKTI